MTELTDTSGTKLEVGLTVAYNKEGKVAKGRIVAIQKRKQYGKDKPLIKVELLSDHWHPWASKFSISKVTSPHNLLVI